jgi:anti-sigma factor RsiW
MNHFDEMTGLLYLEGQLDNDRAQEVRAHSSSCADCRGLLHALQTESVWLRASLEPTHYGADSSNRGERRRRRQASPREMF